MNNLVSTKHSVKKVIVCLIVLKIKLFCFDCWWYLSYYCWVLRQVFLMKDFNWGINEMTFESLSEQLIEHLITPVLYVLLIPLIILYIKALLKYKVIHPSKLLKALTKKEEKQLMTIYYGCCISAGTLVGLELIISY